MEKIVKRINIAYYLIYTLTILATITGYMMNMSGSGLGNADPKSNLSIALSSLVIAYILVSIPGALALFNRSTKKWRLIEDEYIRVNKYATGAIWRLLVIGFGLVLSIVAFYIIRSESMIFTALISAVALIFCKPTTGKIMSELNIEEK
ncbi:MAG TPA: hypothetical protein VK152_09880 [Paludibacter sp.]|nr:hypothetical protein [Paludibacter sp.]